jgi:hypothetical protein
MLAVPCCLGLGSLLLLSDPERSSDTTSVPLELSDGGRAIVTVALNGHPYRLAVETGSPNVRITSAAIRDLALNGVGVADGDSVFHLDSLGIGSVVVRGLGIARGDEVARLGVDGVLGLDAYRDYLLTLDYPGARLSLSSDTLPQPDGRVVLEAVRVGPFLGVELDVGGVKEIGVVDTQAGTGFQALPNVADRLTFESPLRVVGRAVVGGGQPIEVKGARLQGDLRIGRHAFARPRIDVHELPPDIPSKMTIGLRALRHFALALDQRSMRVRFARPGTTAILD